LTKEVSALNIFIMEYLFNQNKKVRREVKSKEIKTPYAELFSSFPDDGSARTLTSDEQKKCQELAKQLSNN